jgi:hypothetical protein
VAAHLARGTVPPAGTAAEQDRYAVGMDSLGSIVRAISARERASIGSRLSVPLGRESLAQWLLRRRPTKPAPPHPRVRVSGAEEGGWCEPHASQPQDSLAIL